MSKADEDKRPVMNIAEAVAEAKAVEEVKPKLPEEAPVLNLKLDTDAPSKDFIPCSFMHVSPSTEAAMVMNGKRDKSLFMPTSKMLLKTIWKVIIAALVIIILIVLWKIWFQLFPLKKRGKWRATRC
jgi:hypothetical protein